MDSQPIDALEEMEGREKRLPLNSLHVQKLLLIVNRLHVLLHSTALAFMFYYRVCFLFQPTETREGHELLPWLLVSASEAILSFLWVLDQAFRWRPVSRSVFPERLPEDHKLSPIDVFICTADPTKEPTLDVMNTVLSSMALDYPPNKLHVYLSDDAGSPLTLHGMREACKFARWWLPFCRRYKINNRCPKAYFSALEDNAHADFARSSLYVADKHTIKEKYEAFEEAIKTFRKDSASSRDHPSLIEVIQESTIDDVDNVKMPLLVYVSREKMASHPHHFKAGALNVLVQWQGMDGLMGPVMSGTGFYIKRASLFGNCASKGSDLLQQKDQFGSSNEFGSSLDRDYTSESVSDQKHTLLEESHLLASCNYEIGTKWGEEVGFLYYSVVEDYLTGFMLHCNGWSSVFCEPSRPQFLGKATTNLNDVLIQGTRWHSGLFENGINRFCPLMYWPTRLPFLQCLCFAWLTYFPLYCVPLCCLATVPQLSLLNGIPLYPKVSDPFFIVFVFIFLSALVKHLLEVSLTGGTLHKWINEQRIWMMKSVTCNLHGCLDALLKKFGIREATFVPTNKLEDDEQTLLYQMDKYDFRASNIFIAPMLFLITVNIYCLVGGVYRVFLVGDWDKLFIQLFLAVFIVTVNYPLVEGLLLRKDKGRISKLVAIPVILPTLALLAFFNLLGNV
ncbi:cellulose synthase-like protein G1 isoform X2 [Vigna angularis]|uniref:cellulose synthase-like protein G1 isoform X2 n=1 Tax=Phaseolus angularis TaxID=3914 RepID=UPI0022B3395C|nr:cellulose synthase-like protein G1 isoform X2 [Vigna angularis]